MFSRSCWRPITHHSEIFPQIRALRRSPFEQEQLHARLTIFVIGLFRGGSRRRFRALGSERL